MKQSCFLFFICLSLLLFCLLSCEKEDTLYDILSESLAEEKLPTGCILCYGREYENAMSERSLLGCLSLEVYPSFAERIEDFALFSTLKGEYSEVLMIRLYRFSDREEARLLLERRLKDIKRALNTSGKKGSVATYIPSSTCC